MKNLGIRCGRNIGQHRLGEYEGVSRPAINDSAVFQQIDHKISAVNLIKKRSERLQNREKLTFYEDKMD